MNNIDGLQTLQYNKAHRYKVPKNYIIVERNGTSTNIIKSINRIYNTNGSINDIVELSKQFDIGVEHVIMLSRSINIDINLDKVDYIMIKNGLSPYLSVDTFQERYESWLHVHNNMMMRTLVMYNHIHNIQRQLLDIESTQLRDFSIFPNKSTKVYQVLPRAEMLLDWNITSIYDVVNNTNISQYVPFIQSPNNSICPIYRIFHTEDVLATYDNQNFLSFSQDKFLLDHIYFYVWNGKNINSKNSYIECVYNASNTTMEISSNTNAGELEESIEIIKEHIEAALPFFKFTRDEIKTINAEITYSDIELNESLFFFMIDQDPVFSSYLTIFENTNLRTSDKKVTMTYNNIVPEDCSSIIIKFRSKMVDNASAIIMSIIGARSNREILEISNVMNYLFVRYDVILPSYEKCVLSRLGDVPEAEEMVYNIPISKGRALSRQFPEVFGDADAKIGYCRSCQKPLQPIIIDDDEIDSWEKMTINGHKRQIGQFPPPQEGVKPLFNYICPNDDSPWPGIQVNKGLASLSDTLGKKVYPMVPCCVKEDRWTQYLTTGKGPYAKYYNDTVTIGKEKIFKTRKPVKEGSLGALPNVVKSHLDMSQNITDYISNITTKIRNATSGKSNDEDEENDEDIEDDPNDITEIDTNVGDSHYMHYSVGQKLDSFISCILYAVQSLNNYDGPYAAELKKYNHKKNNIDLPQIIRSAMASLNHSLYAQENVNGTDDMLVQKLLDGYVDPRLYYRGLEEIFNINIFLFNADTNNVMLPYANITHIRYLRRDNPCVLIWYHPTFMVSELIVKLDTISSEGKKNKIRTFGPNMVDRMYETLNTSYVLSDHNVFKDAFSQVDWRKVLGGIYEQHGWITFSQTIDANGKCRGFNIFKDSHIITLYVYPCQPLNLDTTTFKSTVVPYNTAIEFMGTTPYSFSGSSEEKGLWFSGIGIDEYAFIPIDKDDSPESLNLKPSINVSPHSSSDIIMSNINHEDDIIKMSALLVDLVWWMYLVENNSRVSASTFSTWWDTFVVYDDNIDQSNITYHPIQKLKLVKTSKEAINCVTDSYPTVFFGGMIHFPSSLDKGFKCMMLQKARENTALHIPIPIYLNKRYSKESDFNQIGSKTFLSRTALEIWTESMSKVVHTQRFILSLDEVHGSQISLYRYNGNIYIIQKEKNTRRAVYNSYQFQQTHINNYSLKMQPLSTEELPYISYIMINGTLFTKSINDVKSNDTSYGEIIENGEDVYSLLNFNA